MAAEAVSKAERDDVPESEKWVTVNRASKMLGNTRYTILNRITRGEFRRRYIKESDTILVSREDVEAAMVREGVAARRGKGAA